MAAVGARAATGHLIDGFPIAVGPLGRAGRRQVLKAAADDGYGAAKRESYAGLNAHLLIGLRGVAVSITLTPANRAERAAAADGLQALAGRVLGAKGSIRPPFHAAGEALGLALQTPVRQTLKEHRPRWGRQL